MMGMHIKLEPISIFKKAIITLTMSSLKKLIIFCSEISDLYKCINVNVEHKLIVIIEYMHIA